MKTHPALIMLLWFAVPLKPSGFAQTEALKTVQERSAELQKAHLAFVTDLLAFAEAHATDAPQDRQQAMLTFQRQNQSRLEGLRFKAESIVPAEPAAEIPLIRQVEIPENASPATEGFLVRRAQMRNEQAKVLNAVRDATPEQKQAALLEWHVKNRSEVALLNQAAQFFEEPRELIPLPSAPRIPKEASPDLRDSLLRHDAQIRQYIEAENGLRRAASDERAAADKMLLQAQKATVEAVSVQPAKTITILDPKSESNP